MGKNSKTLLRELRKSKADLASLSQYLHDCELSLEDYQKEWSLVLSMCYKSFSKEENNQEDKDIFDKEDFVISPDKMNKRWRKTKDGWKDDNNSPETVPDKSPQWVKKIFRKLAFHTHPDRTSEKKLNDFYNQASESVENEDYQNLLRICDQLNIEYEVDPELELKMSREKQEKIKLRLKEIDTLPAWIWGESMGVTEFRSSFLKSFLMSQKFQNIEDEKINTITESFEK